MFSCRAQRASLLPVSTSLGSILETFSNSPAARVSLFQENIEYICRRTANSVVSRPNRGADMDEESEQKHRLEVETRFAEDKCSAAWPAD